MGTRSGVVHLGPVGRRLGAARGRMASRGQMLVLFAVSIFVLTGITAIVVDVSWYWANSLRVQRAADAAALAGVVWLPSDTSNAYSIALKEATKNGYSGANPGVTVSPLQDGSNKRRLNVTISAPVSTYFARILGINSFRATRTAKAEFVLPVPMGSPDNYYGVFGKVRTPNGGVTKTTPGDTGWLHVTAPKGTNAWANFGAVYQSDDNFATSSTAGEQQAWGTPRTTTNASMSVPGGASITGIQVRLEADRTTGNNCQIQVRLSRDNGLSYTTGTGTGIKNTPNLDANPNAQYTLGSSSDLWNRASWSSSDLSDGNFRVRLENIHNGSCAGTTNLDYVEVIVHYQTSTFVPDSNLAGPDGSSLTPRGFWGTFINQGAEKVNGDAYLPHWNPRKSGVNAEYDPVTYYNYGVEIPAGNSGGQLWVYDPLFCATDTSGQYGTGDRYFSGSDATSAYYTLYDTMNTPYDLQDDVANGVIASSGSLFANIRASDESLDGPDLGNPGASTDCSQGATSNQGDGRYWHNRWWPLAKNLQGGHTYRLHTTSTSAAGSSAMDDANGHNSFALWSTASGGSKGPRIYGIGAMEAFTPLDGGGSAEFYLAQIDAVHSGKTMRIKLWDPGDTGSLSASLQILRPVQGGAPTPASFTWTAVDGTPTTGSSCPAGGSGSSITTNTGGSSVFNGCWLTIDVSLKSYTAPQSAGDPEPGWWRIRYTMGGSSSNKAFDLTTWQVEILGNPVHLVIP
jgi:Flp pilus assembly protein TadG